MALNVQPVTVFAGRAYVLEHFLPDRTFLASLHPYLTGLTVRDSAWSITRKQLDTICCLTRLTALSLNSHKEGVIITSPLPLQFSNLSSLHDLALSSYCVDICPFRPESLCSLAQLTRLSIEGLPRSLAVLSHLTSLRSLSLAAGSGAQVPCCLPPHMGGLSSLQALELVLLEFSGGILQLSQLSELQSLLVHSVRLPQGGVQEFGAALAAMKGLTGLTLGFDDYGFAAGHFPTSALDNLSRLEKLVMSGGLQQLDCCSAWKGLTRLDLSNNEFDCMPSNITRLTNLQRLGFGCQSDEFQLPGPLHFISQLPNLIDVSFVMDGPDHDDHVWAPSSIKWLLDAYHVLRQRSGGVIDF